MTTGKTAGLSSLPPAQASRQQPARWRASRPHPESSRSWKYVASKLSFPAGLHGLDGATTEDPWTDVPQQEPLNTAGPQKPKASLAHKLLAKLGNMQRLQTLQTVTGKIVKGLMEPTTNMLPNDVQNTVSDAPKRMARVCHPGPEE